MQSLLFILSQPPYRGSRLQETLDLLLTAAAFEQEVELLFLDDGVMQLFDQQQPDILGVRDTSAIFKALEIYSIRPPLVEYESLTERGLDSEALLLTTRIIHRSDINRLCRQFHRILSD